jgi:hypothetical protein
VGLGAVVAAVGVEAGAREEFGHRS